MEKQLIALTDSTVDIDGVAVPTKAGHQFAGWFYDANQVSGTMTMSVSGLTVTAKWAAADQVVHFDSMEVEV